MRTVPLRREPAGPLIFAEGRGGKTDRSNEARERIVSLDRVGDLLASYEIRSTRPSPFWITVEDGEVVAIEEE